MTLRRIISLLGLIAADGCFAWKVGSGLRAQPASPTVVTRMISITRHNLAALTDAQADQILKAATAAIAVKDSPSDIACAVTLQKSGSVTLFAAGSGTVDSEADFNTVCHQPGLVHVVNDISWCGATLANIKGCSTTPGTCMVVVRHQDDEEGILWAHEYGHTRGLEHRNEDRVILNPVLGPNHNEVNSDECQAFRTNFQPALSAASTIHLLPVRQFIQQTFPHGIPYSVGKAFASPRDVEFLAGVLEDPKQERYWGNAAALLGYAATSRSVAVLQSFLQRGEGRLSRNAYAGKTAALIGLGYAANAGNNKEALQYLQQGILPQVWSERQIKWSSPFAEGTRGVPESLSSKSLQALAVAGSQEARATLEGARSLLKERSREVDQALKEFERVRASGLSRYGTKRLNSR